MLVSRKVFDATAALSCGAGVVLIVTGVKPVPSVISYLGLFSAVWGGLLLLSCAGAAVGAMLRTRDATNIRRGQWSVGLERIFWPAIAGCAFVFCVGVVYQFGWIDAAQTLGWTGFVICVCLGNWWVIRLAARSARTP